MRLAHQAEVRSSLEARFGRLSSSSVRRWGAMTVGQMMLHVNRVLLNALGEYPAPDQGSRAPRLVKLFVLYGPWPKGAPAVPNLRVTEDADFDTQAARFPELFARFVSKPLSDVWVDHPVFRAMTGRDWSRLQYRHLDHHFRQFGA